MMPPKAIELPRHLEPVTPDTFIGAPEPPPQRDAPEPEAPDRSLLARCGVRVPRVRLRRRARLL